ncbi:MAG: hypothetical protein QW056_02150 [Candidatus Bathyarchaeia archaeon]
MPRARHHDFLAVSILILSIIGTTLVLPITVFKPIAYLDIPWRKTLIGSLLAILCIAGIPAALLPGKCAKATHRSRRETAGYKFESPAPQKVAVVFRGHHPDCGKFDAHIVHIMGNEYCAACTGLALGALIVLAGTFLYFFIEYSMENFGLWAIFAGQIGVALGLFQFKFRNFMRLALNAIFVIACFLILAGADSVAGNLLLDLYIFGLILYWLFTRIMLSKWDHTRICRKCGFSCI